MVTIAEKRAYLNDDEPQKDQRMKKPRPTKSENEIIHVYCGDLVSIRCFNFNTRTDGKTGNAEIVKWNCEEFTSCYVIAILRREKEGYTIEFVGTRPFNCEISPNKFMAIAKEAQSIMNAIFDAEEGNYND